MGTILAHVAPAGAQSLDSYFPNGVPGYDAGVGVTVQTRQRPDYDFPTYHVANAEVSPQVSQSIGYNDNLYGTPQLIGSFFENTNASVVANSQFSHSGVGGSVAVNDIRYFSQPTLNETGGTAALGGSYDIGEDRLSAAYSFAAEHENPGDIATSGFDKPIPYFVNRFQTNYALDLNRVVLTPALEFDTWRYDNTSLRDKPVLETYRNRDTIQGTLTGRYQLTDLNSLLVVANVTNNHYISPIRGFLAPDNTGYSLLAGVDFTPSAIWHYRALVGYEVRTYATSTVATQASPVAQVSATYTPTGLTTFTGTLSRTIEDAATNDGAGYTYTTAELRADHELFRNILLNGQFTYQRADYVPSPLQVAGSQSIFRFGGGVTWLLNQYARVTAGYQLTYNDNGNSVGNGKVVTVNGVNLSKSNFGNSAVVTLQIGSF